MKKQFSSRLLSLFLTFLMVLSLVPAFPQTVLANTEVNYARLLQTSLYFFDANMCGHNVTTRSQFAWRNNCHLQDQNISVPSGMRGEGGPTTIDLRGGFHDAGDHVKFNLPIAFAGVSLGWAVYEYREEFAKAGSLDHAERILNHFAEYYKRCVVYQADGTIASYAYQVGDGGGGNDHGYWGNPSNQTGSAAGANRNARFTDLSAGNPGTDQVAIAAALLAQNYVNFGDQEDLDVALALFNWASSGSKAVATAGTTGYYNSSRWQDKLALAGEWLVIATGSTSYRRDSSGNPTTSSTSSIPHINWAYSWDNAWPQVAILRQNWEAAERELNTDRINRNTPTNYSNWSNWGNARYNAAMQGLALVRDNRRNQSTYSTWAHEQMRFLLGNNTTRNSYVLGYPSINAGTPTVAQTAMRLHHRAASGTNTFPWNAGNPNPANLLTGALLGGPATTNGSFKNDYEDYEHTEVTCDYNGSLVLAAAGHYRKNPTHTPVPLSEIPGNFRTLVVTPTPPTITSANNLTVAQGTARTMSITASGSTPITYTLTGAPSGVTISGNTLNIAASVASGSHTFTINATNAHGSATQSFTLNISRTIRFNWNPNKTAPVDINVSRGATDHVLMLSGLEITPCIISANGDATLTINYTSQGNNSNRRLLAWTNLSGTSGLNNISFLTTARLTDPASVIISPDTIIAGASTATLTIPRRLLTSGTNTATTLYVALATNQGLTGTGNTYTQATNHRGGGDTNEFTRFDSVVLTTAAVTAPTNPVECGVCNNLPCRCTTAPITYPITISGGGTGASASPNPAAQGTLVTLNAGTAPTGQTFLNWTASGVTIQNATSQTSATFTMPANAVTVTANWQSGGTPVAPTVNWPTGLTATVGQTLGQVALPTSNTGGTAGTFSWTAGNSTSVGAVGVRSHNVTFTPSNPSAFLSASSNVNITVSAASTETVLYDMQTTTRHTAAGFSAFSGTGSLSGSTLTAFAPLDRTGAAGTTTFTASGNAGNRAVVVTQRSGVAHAIRLMLGGTNGLGGNGTPAIPISAGNLYRIEYSGTFPAGGTPRIRFEGASGNVVPVAQVPGGTQEGNHVIFDGTAVGINVPFTHGITLTRDQLVAIGARNVSLSATSQNIDIHYSNIRIIELPAGSATNPVTIQSGVTGVAVQGGPSFAPGATVTLNITPPTGYRLAANGITATGVSVTNAVGATTATFTMPANAVTITAMNFVPLTYTVTFNLNGGTHTGGGAVTQTINHGSAATAPILTRSGYVLGGWSTPLTNVTANTTITANWLRLGALSSGGTGSVSSADVVWLARAVAGHAGFTMPLPTDPLFGVADINGDGAVNAADVTAFMRWLVWGA
ncbi:MAG: glycoside hydrolase family 9 protein [Defluviitaleaceae bacterium]|nr:glycoside hydrolase family 9 protein [Defluviitaleaceae bacterium]